MRATFDLVCVLVVVDDDEDVADSAQVWEYAAKGIGVFSLEEHVGHTWAEKHYVLSLSLQEFTFQPSRSS